MHFDQLPLNGTINLRTGFPCRQWIKRIGGGEQLCCVVFCTPSESLTGQRLDQPEPFVVCRLRPPYAVLSHHDGMFNIDTTVWTDTRLLRPFFTPGAAPP